MVDAVLEQEVENRIGFSCFIAPSAAAPKITRLLSWSVFPKRDFVNHL
jgi:hypothetical protein